MDIVELVEKGDRLLELFQIEEAISLYKQAVELDPDSAPLHYKVAHAFIESENLSRSEDWCKRTIALNPKFHWGYFGLSKTMQKKGNLREAVTACNKSLELKADFKPAQDLLALLNELGGEPENSLNQPLNKREDNKGHQSSDTYKSHLDRKSETGCLGFDSVETAIRSDVDRFINLLVKKKQIAESTANQISFQIYRSGHICDKDTEKENKICQPFNRPLSDYEPIVSVDLNNKDVIGYGWDLPDSDGRWMLAESASISLPNLKPQEDYIFSMIVTSESYPNLTKDLAVYINDKKIGLKVESFASNYRCPLEMSGIFSVDKDCAEPFLDIAIQINKEASCKQTPIIYKLKIKKISIYVHSS